MASLYEQQEEMLGEGARGMRVPRDRPLAEGEVRERDMDRDPQIIWNGAKIRITAAQMRQLAETGEIEIGDAQLVWRGKDRQDWSDLVVNAPPLYIQEKVHPKAIIDDLKRKTTKAREATEGSPRSVCRFQRHRRSRGAGRILPAYQALAEPLHPRRQPAGDGIPRRARGDARQGAVHLFRPALWHQVQFELAGLDHEPRC